MNTFKDNRIDPSFQSQGFVVHDHDDLRDYRRTLALKKFVAVAVFVMVTLAIVFWGSLAFAKDRTIIVLEASVVPAGGDYTITADGGCDAIVRIAPIADQRPALVRRWSKKTCDAVKAESINSAKLDQGMAE